MKKALWFGALLLLVVGVAQAASEPDTTLKATKGIVFIHGYQFNGPEVTFRVSGRRLIADTPRGPMTLWDLPDPDAPGPPVPASVIARSGFVDTLDVRIRELQREKKSRKEMREALDVLCRTLGVADSVVPAGGPGIFYLYWQDGTGEMLEVSGPGGKYEGKVTEHDIRRSHIIFIKSLIKDLDEDYLFFISSPDPRFPFGRPPLSAFRYDYEKRRALRQVARVLQGKADDLGLLTAPVVADLHRRRGAR